MECSDGSKALHYSCLPASEGNLTCVASSSNRHGLIRRPMMPIKPARRTERSVDEKGGEEKEEEEWSLWKELRNVLGASLPAWNNLLPGIVGCSCKKLT